MHGISHSKSMVAVPPSSSSRYGWTEDDSGPIPSDIELVRGGPTDQTDGNQSQPMFSGGGDSFSQQHPPYPPPRYPLSDYRLSNGSPQLVTATASGTQFSMWSRSYQNPIGTVYHGPGEKSEFLGQSADGGGGGSGGGGSGSGSGGGGGGGSGLASMQWSGARGHHADQSYYLTQQPPPVYSSASSGYSPAAYGVPHYTDTKLRERARGQRQQRPNSADVSKLFSVQEDASLGAAAAEVAGVTNIAAQTSTNGSREAGAVGFKKGKQGHQDMSISHT